ncbi:MAG: tetratricopeptide repeat protein, partial [Pseudomonadota bacterium]
PKPTAQVSYSQAPGGDARMREVANAWGERFTKDKTDARAALNYAAALDQLGQQDTAVAVLEQAAMRNPQDRTLLASYGKALNKVGRSDQALQVLSKADSPEAPDWKVLSAKGVSLDQMGSHDQAQALYERALKVAPNEPRILSNYGLSLALTKDLERAEAMLRRATQLSDDPRVWQNLALVLGLQGRNEEAERIAARRRPGGTAATSG